MIFDVDGTLVDSEQEGHRVAFNQAFAAAGLPDRWNRATYHVLLGTTGGKRRLRRWFADPRSSQHQRSEEARAELAAELHQEKTARFRAMAGAGEIPARPGVGRLLDDLRAAGVTVGVATTGNRSWVEPLLEQRFGLDRFACIVTGDDVAEQKPAPDAYRLAVRRLGLMPSDAMAVEDSGPGIRSAVAAGLACLVVANEETDPAAYRDSPLVVTGFGVETAPMTVVRDDFGVVDATLLTSATLARFHAAAVRAARPPSS